GREDGAGIDNPSLVNFRIMTYLSLSAIIFLVGLIIIYWIHNQYHLDIVVEPSAPPQNGAMISICVPARNEQQNIRSCVEAILAQTYPNFEVIVVDDRSTDETPEILHNLAARNDKLKITLGLELPSGWTGKPHALYQAAASARGEWLCFIDA